jgi:hypothetical protein
VVAALLLVGLFMLTLPIGHAEWREVLGVGGSVGLGAWSPPDSDSSDAPATPDAPDSPDPGPSPEAPGQVQASALLEAALTAGGLNENREWGVSGATCVTNQGEAATAGLVLTHIVQAQTGGGEFQDLLGVSSVFTPTEPLLPGVSGCYDYRLSFEPAPGAQYRVSALVTILNHAGWLPGGPNCAGPEPCPFGPAPMAEFALPVEAVDTGEVATAEPAPPTETATAPPAEAPGDVSRPLPPVTPGAP